MKSLFLTALVFGGLTAIAAAADFWDTRPGARANAMGTAFTAVADDASAVFYNPAGLGQQDGTAVMGGAGRRFTQQGAAGEAFFSYVTPYTERESGMWGIGYYGFYNKNDGDRTTAVLSFGDKYYSLADHPLPLPLLIGFGVRGTSAKFQGRSEGLLGADFGLMAEFAHNIKAGLSIEDLRLAGASEPPNPFFNTGVAWRFRNFLFSADYRHRNGLGELYPGAEMAVGDGRLKFRAGKATPYNSVAQTAFGAGFDAGIAVIDAAFSIPWTGLGQNDGFFMLSATVRLGETAEREKPAAKPLPPAQADTNTRRLLERQKRLENDLTEYQNNEKNFRDKVKLLENRIDTLQSSLKEKDRALDDLNRKTQTRGEDREELNDAMSGQAALPAAADSSWPKKHIVSDNDTLRSIASRYYGSSALWTQIEAANADKISKGLPAPGAELTIPAPPGQ